MSDQNELVKFGSKKYRDGYLQSRVRGRIAYQIQALREKLGLTQQAFAELTGKKQSTISRLEDTEYGKVSVQTLLDIACATDVALVVKFSSYPDFLDQTRLMGALALQPETIHESLANLHSRSTEQPALARALIAPEQGVANATALSPSNDNYNLAHGAAIYHFSATPNRPRLVS